MTTALFTPLTIRSMTARNRLWVSPMCQYSCEDKDGVPTEWHLVHLGSFARGGAGLIIAEASGVLPEGRITPWCTGIWNDEQRDAWARIVDFIHSQGAMAGIQLAHAGRKGSTHRDWSGRGSVPLPDGGWTTVAPSPEAFTGYETPRELSPDEIRALPGAWAAAARRALDAGFDVLEVHAAHGYLIHQFLSPLSNHREDEWGGPLENRARLLLDVVRAVREEAGEDVPVFVRLSATDWAEPEGWTVDQTVTVAEWVRDAGADLVDVSSGGLVTGVHIPTAPNYQVPFASAVRAGAHVPTGAVGQIVGAHQAEQIVASGDADAVFVGREFLRDPHLPLRVAHELGEHLDYWPNPYTRADFGQRPDVD
jgi:2,4-dienoyl-CoA reductase-like NADH-dependent reductase (Old Yellow Enzyme family)